MIDYIPGGAVDIHSKIQPFQIKQYDNNSHKLFLTIIDRDNPFGQTVDLRGHSVRAYFILPDGSDEFINCEIVRAKSGKIAVPFPGSVTQQTGTVECELCIIGESNSIISLRKFSFDVVESIRDTSAMEASEKYSALEAALSAVQGFSNDIGAAVADVQSMRDSVDADIQRLRDDLDNLLESDRYTELSAEIQQLKNGLDNLIASDRGDELDAVISEVQRLREVIENLDVPGTVTVTGEIADYISTTEEFLSLFDFDSDVGTEDPPVVEETAPNTPTGFTAAYNISDGKVYISWNAVTDATSYTLRKKSGGVWSTLQNSSSRSYTDTSVTAGASYQYEVTANKTGSSGRTLSSSAVTVNVDIPSVGDSTTDTTPTAPTSVTATAGNGKNTITWSGATNAQYYTLERKEGGNAWVAIVSNYTGASYTDTNVTGGISYQYRVTAHRMDTSGNVLSSSTVQSTAITAQTSTGDNWPTAAEIVNDIKVGWTLAGALDCTYEKVKTNEINTDSEGLAYEKGWGNPETTEYTFKAVKEMGFNAVRIPVTWNHHLRSAGNDNITISSYFLDRVKRVVKWAYDEGLYVVINSHYDTATYSSGRSSTYASSTTGLTWNTAIPYQLFNADSTPSNSTQCRYIAKLWTQIATAFKDYGYRLMFEGFHEIQGNPRNNSAPTSDQIANVNALNNAFINAVRAVSGNEQRTLLCQTYNALNSGDAVTGFNVVNSGYEILDIKLFTDNTSTISGITSTLTSKGYPVVFGTSGWSTAPSGDNANFARTFAQAVKNAGARLFWWDDCGSSYKLLDRTATNAQISGSLWTRLSTAQALVEGSGGNHGTGLCIASDTTGTIGGTPITSPETATEVVSNIKIGWNLGNTLDCSHGVVHIYEDPYDHTSKRVLGTEYEGVGYETSWGDTPVVTQAMLEAVVNAGFNAIRIPVTWAHHLRDEALPYDWGADKEWTTEIEEYPNLSGNIIISPYFLSRVKTIVNYALNAGFRYVILNSHWDTADYNNGKPFGYAKKVTGVPWITEIPYQFFHASKQLGSTLSAQYPNMTADDDYNNMLGYMRQMWTLIANAFKDYDYRLIFEGFNEILAYDRNYKEPEAIHVSRTNGFNEAFINAVRATGGKNADRILSCETFAAYGSNNALNGFTLPSAETSADRIILQAHIYNNAPTEFANAAQRINEKVGIPAIFGEVGWSTNSGTPSDLYNFGYNLVQEAKSAGVKVFWWDNNKEGTGTNYYGLLNRWNTDSNNAAWHKPALLKGLIKGSGQTIDWIENLSV